MSSVSEEFNEGFLVPNCIRGIPPEFGYIKPVKQSNDYNCAVYALRYLLAMQGYDQEPTESDLRVVYNEGTAMSDIRGYLIDQCITFYEPVASMHLTHTPCMVGYNTNPGDSTTGHFGVVLERRSSTFLLTDSGPGVILEIRYDEFKKTWDFPDCGKRPCIHIFKRGTNAR